MAPCARAGTLFRCPAVFTHCAAGGGRAHLSRNAARPYFGGAAGAERRACNVASYAGSVNSTVVPAPGRDRMRKPPPCSSASCLMRRRRRRNAGRPPATAAASSTVSGAGCDRTRCAHAQGSQLSAAQAACRAMTCEPAASQSTRAHCMSGAQRGARPAAAHLDFALGHAEARVGHAHAHGAVEGGRRGGAHGDAARVRV